MFTVYLAGVAAKHPTEYWREGGEVKSRRVFFTLTLCSFGVEKFVRCLGTQKRVLRYNTKRIAAQYREYCGTRHHRPFIGACLGMHARPDARYIDRTLQICAWQPFFLVFTHICTSSALLRRSFGDPLQASCIDQPLPAHRSGFRPNRIMDGCIGIMHLNHGWLHLHHGWSHLHHG